MGRTSQQPYRTGYAARPLNLTSSDARIRSPARSRRRNGVYCCYDGTYGMVVRDAGAVALVADANEDGRFVMAETRDLRPMKLVACPECGHVADEEELRYVPRSYADPGYCDGCTTCIPHVEAEWEHPDI